MSMITQCPACGTAFRVTPPQLQAQHGMVRCGRCAHVFDGFKTLAALRADTPLDAGPQPAGHAPEPAAESAAQPVIETTPPAPLRPAVGVKVMSVPSKLTAPFTAGLVTDSTVRPALNGETRLSASVSLAKSAEAARTRGMSSSP
ncbi:MAG: zinc-ribbon domain-containing protein, partial [Pseudomonadota bacterium]